MHKIAVVALLTLTPMAAFAEAKWQQAPEPIHQILGASQPPGIAIAPNKKWIIEFERPALPGIADLV